jgi:hypothetical protein
VPDLSRDPRYVVVVERRAREHGGLRTAATVGAVGAVGVLLYLLLTRVGLGPGTWGRGEAGRGEATGPVATDRSPLLFRLGGGPGKAPRGSKLTLEPAGQEMTIDDAISRVLAGNRRDVNLRVTGDAIHGDLIAFLVAAGRQQITTGLIRSRTSMLRPQGFDTVHTIPPRADERWAEAELAEISHQEVAKDVEEEKAAGIRKPDGTLVDKRVSGNGRGQYGARHWSVA